MFTSTWSIMLGFEALTVLISLAGILAFMFKKEPSEVTAPAPDMPAVLADHAAMATKA